jgi:hypothetical protein
MPLKMFYYGLPLSLSLSLSLFLLSMLRSEPRGADPCRVFAARRGTRLPIWIAMCQRRFEWTWAKSIHGSRPLWTSQKVACLLSIRQLLLRSLLATV